MPVCFGKRVDFRACEVGNTWCQPIDKAYFSGNIKIPVGHLNRNQLGLIENTADEEHQQRKTEQKKKTTRDHGNIVYPIFLPVRLKYLLWMLGKHL